MNLAASRTPAALGEQLRSGLGDQLGELVMQSGGGAGELADAADHVARDEDPDRGFGAVKAPGDLDLPGRMHQRLCRDLPFRPQIVQLPARLVESRVRLAISRSR